MLVLSRRAGESIVIGGDIRVTVTDVSGDRVKIAIEADRAINIRRAELKERVEGDSDGQ